MSTTFHEELAPQQMTPVTGVVARVVNALSGLWIAISGFVLEQSLYARMDSYTVGALMMIFAINAFWFRRARYLNTALSVWLALSTAFIFHRSGGAMWNAYVGAIVVFAFSLIPTGLRPTYDELAQRH